MKGRPIIPAEVLKLKKGKLYDVQRDREKMTPKPMKSLKPICPRTFTKEQRKVWNKYSKILKNYNMFTAGNQLVLEQLCFWLDIFDRHRENLNNIDVLADDSENRGNNVYQKSFNVCKNVYPMIKSCMQELGLSSSGLAKIGSLAASATKKQSKWEEKL